MIFRFFYHDETTGHRVIDFTEKFWGHALHGETWYEFSPEPSFWKRAAARLLGRQIKREAFSSVLVHSLERPRVGDEIRYRSFGGVSFCIVVEVMPYGDPHDMFKLILRRRDAV